MASMDCFPFPIISVRTVLSQLKHCQDFFQNVRSHRSDLKTTIYHFARLTKLKWFFLQNNFFGIFFFVKFVSKFSFQCQCQTIFHFDVRDIFLVNPLPPPSSLKSFHWQQKVIILKLGSSKFFLCFWLRVTLASHSFDCSAFNWF